MERVNMGVVYTYVGGAYLISILGQSPTGHSQGAKYPAGASEFIASKDMNVIYLLTDILVMIPDHIR